MLLQLNTSWYHVVFLFFAIFFVMFFMRMHVYVYAHFLIYSVMFIYMYGIFALPPKQQPRVFQNNEISN